MRKVEVGRYSQKLKKIHAELTNNGPNRIDWRLNFLKVIICTFALWDPTLK